MATANLYSRFAKICSKFYDLAVNAKDVANFVDKKISPFKPKKILFIGGFFSVSKELVKKGYDVTVADFTQEMVEEAKKRLPLITCVKADIRDLPFENEFDAVLVIGRVFTHMYCDDDLRKALQSIRNSLKPNGILLFDNYEDIRITKTDCLNGKITVSDGSTKIIRDSSLKIISESPFLLEWKSVYVLREEGKLEKFKDKMLQRAFSRQEIKRLLQKNGFMQIENGDNFDAASFYSLAKKQSTNQMVLTLRAKTIF